MYKNHLQIYW